MCIMLEPSGGELTPVKQPGRGNVSMGWCDRALNQNHQLKDAKRHDQLNDTSRFGPFSHYIKASGVNKRSGVDFSRNLAAFGLEYHYESQGDINASEGGHH